MCYLLAGIPGKIIYLLLLVCVCGNCRQGMEQHALKYGSNTNIYSYLETSGGQSSNLYLNVVCFFNTSVD
jgi:hypothetical protein